MTEEDFCFDRFFSLEFIVYGHRVHCVLDGGGRFFFLFLIFVYNESERSAARLNLSFRRDIYLRIFLASFCVELIALYIQ